MCMHRLRRIVSNKDLLEILNEKEKDDNLPFEALKELCEKFALPFNDEQCGFICANFLRKIYKGSVFIDFAAFLGALKADKDKPVIKEEPSKDDDSDTGKLDQSAKAKRMLKDRKSLDEE